MLGDSYDTWVQLVATDFDLSQQHWGMNQHIEVFILSFAFKEVSKTIHKNKWKLIANFKSLAKKIETLSALVLHSAFY